MSLPSSPVANGFLQIDSEIKQIVLDSLNIALEEKRKLIGDVKKYFEKSTESLKIKLLDTISYLNKGPSSDGGVYVVPNQAQSSSVLAKFEEAIHESFKEILETGEAYEQQTFNRFSGMKGAVVKIVESIFEKVQPIKSFEQQPESEVALVPLFAAEDMAPISVEKINLDDVDFQISAEFERHIREKVTKGIEALPEAINIFSSSFSRNDFEKRQQQQQQRDENKPLRTKILELKQDRKI